LDQSAGTVILLFTDIERSTKLLRQLGDKYSSVRSETTAALLKEGLPEGVSLLDLGRHRLKDIAFAEHIHQLVIKGLPADFPPLKSFEALGLDDT
jgi:class 3 adenylate cyclase